MDFDAKQFIISKINTLDPRFLEKLRKATERKHFYGYMTTEMYEFTIEKIDARIQELSGSQPDT